MIHFYRFLLTWTRFDLAIARSTGRNPAHIATLLADEQKWEREVWNCQNRLHLPG